MALYGRDNGYRKPGNPALIMRGPAGLVWVRSHEEQVQFGIDDRDVAIVDASSEFWKSPFTGTRPPGF